MSSGKIVNDFHFEQSNEFNLNVGFSHYKESISKFPSTFSIKLNNNDLDDILYQILCIHSFLKNNSSLSNNQRLDYCKIERDLMIQYLKQIVTRG